MCGTRRGAGATGYLVEQPSRLHLDRFREPLQRRDLRIAFSCLDPTDLRGVHTTAVRDLFLCQTQPFTRLTQVAAEVSHVGIVCPWGWNLHRKLHKSIRRLSPPHAAGQRRRKKGADPAPHASGPRSAPYTHPVRSAWRSARSGRRVPSRRSSSLSHLPPWSAPASLAGKNRPP